MRFINFKSKLKNIEPIKPTREELFIQYYLDDNGLKYLREHKIKNLNYDKKSHRRVDFYLPKLGIYVEYFGMYNSTKEIRKEYDEKAKVYFKNNLPTVILYPHELGFLDYAFHQKILSVLRIPKFKKLSKTFRYKLSRYFIIGKGYYFFLSIASLIIGFTSLEASKSDYDFNFFIYLILLSFSGVLLLHFFIWIIRVFFYDY